MKEIILPFLFISIFGTVLHFTYDLSNKNIVVGIFSSVNESIWEHIKLLLTPIFVMNFINYILGNTSNYFLILFIELILSIILVILFYKIKILIFKDKKDYINVISFYITVFIVVITKFYLEKNITSNNIHLLFKIPCLIIYIMYLSFTIFPPRRKLFLDPITKTYGINQCK